MFVHSPNKQNYLIRSCKVRILFKVQANYCLCNDIAVYKKKKIKTVIFIVCLITSKFYKTQKSCKV